MANDIIITPGSASIQFSGSANNDTIRLQVEPSGSVAFYGRSGSLFSIVDNLSGSLMSVNDISGLPILEVFSDDRVVMGTFNRNTFVVTGSRIGIDKAVPTADLDISGSVFITGSLSIFSGSITASNFVGTASFATSAISSSFATTSSFTRLATTASTVDGTIDFPNGLIVTGSTLSTNGFTGSLSGTASFALLADDWRYANIYNVREFGATGTSSQDARPFIQAAINAATASGGGTVFVPNGVYSISSSLFMSSSITLIGESVDRTIIRSATQGTGLSFSGSAMISGSDVMWSYIGNMSLIGVGINGTNCVGIRYNNNNRATHDHNVIDRVFMDGMSTYGIHWDNALGGRIQQVRINNTGGDAVRIIGGTAISLQDVYANGSVYNGFFLSGLTYSGLYNTAADSCRTAYRLLSTRNVFFNGCGGEAVASAVGDPDRPGKYFWISNAQGLTLSSCYASGFVDVNSTERTYLDVDNSTDISVWGFRGVTGSYGNNPSFRYRIASGSEVMIMNSDFAGPSSASFEASGSLIQTGVNGVVTYSGNIQATTFIGTATTASFVSGAIDFPNGLTVTGSVTAGGLIMTDRQAASASAGATYTATEQTLLNQIRTTLIKYGMLT